MQSMRFSPSDCTSDMEAGPPHRDGQHAPRINHRVAHGQDGKLFQRLGWGDLGLRGRLWRGLCDFFVNRHIQIISRYSAEIR